MSDADPASPFKDFGVCELVGRRQQTSSFLLRS